MVLLFRPLRIDDYTISIVDNRIRMMELTTFSESINDASRRIVL